MLFIAHIIWRRSPWPVNNPDRRCGKTWCRPRLNSLAAIIVGRAYYPQQLEDFRAPCRALMILVLCSAPFALVRDAPGRPILPSRRCANCRRQQPSPFNNARQALLNLERVQFALPTRSTMACFLLCRVFPWSYVGLKDWLGAHGASIASNHFAGCGFLALSAARCWRFSCKSALIAWARSLPPQARRAGVLVACSQLGLCRNRHPVEPHPGCKSS